MDETREQARLREHLAQMGHAAKGIGKDVSLDMRKLEDKISKLPRLTAKEAKYALYDIEDDMAYLGKKIGSGAREVPGMIKNGLETAGTAVGSTVSRAAIATGQALESAGHRTREGGRNAAAWAAGVKRTPMKEWKTVEGDSAASDDQ